eukprot:gene8233-biopygen903
MKDGECVPLWLQSHSGTEKAGHNLFTHRTAHRCVGSSAAAALDSTAGKGCGIPPTCRLGLITNACLARVGTCCRRNGGHPSRQWRCVDWRTEG